MLIENQPANAASNVGIIILAAGASTRLGQPKQLLLHHSGRTLLRYAAEQALASLGNSVIIILGAHAAAVRSEVSGLSVHITHNLHWSEGMSASLRAGLTALQNINSKAEAALVMLCDQPFVDAAFINKLILAYRDSKADIVAAEYEGTVGVPALFSRLHFAQLANLHGASGAKRIITELGLSVVRVPLAEGTIDIDTQDDYRRYQLSQPKNDE